MVSIIIILTFLALLIGPVFNKIIKHYNYELNFKESILYSSLILIISFWILTNFKVTSSNLWLYYLIGLGSYYLLLLIIYYILRFRKLKKYIPFKAIVGYLLISIIYLVILFNFPTSKLSNINGWDMLGVFLFYILISVLHIFSLLIINFIFLIINHYSKEDNNYNNIKYKISKFNFINIFIIILLIVQILMINYYNTYKYKELIEEQKNVVINYLKKEYPNYEFAIIDIKEEGINCWIGCRDQAFKNKILNKETNNYFNIYVEKENLTIYEDEFKSIIENEDNK